MSNADDRKYFEFSRLLFDDPMKMDYIKVYHVGEVALEAGAVITEHKQQCHEISFVLSGEGSFSTEGNVMNVSMDDIHVISKGKLHEISSKTHGGFRYAYIGFNFNEELIGEETRDIVEFYGSCPMRIVRDSGEIRLIFGMLINEWYAEPSHKEISIECLTKYLIVLTQRAYADDFAKRFLPQKNKAFIGQNVYDIIRYIDNNVFEIESIKKLSRKFGYNENYISHLFKSKTGTSITNYIANVKIKYAAEMLRAGKNSITEISEIMNYSSSQAFCKMFRKHMHCSPSEYRQRNL